jgi:hypothetical protein
LEELGITIKLFSDDCIIYSEIMNDSEVKTLQIDLDRLGEWVVENAMKINPGKRKSVSFTRIFLEDEIIPGVNSCRYGT